MGGTKKRVPKNFSVSAVRSCGNPIHVRGIEPLGMLDERRRSALLSHEVSEGTMVGEDEADARVLRACVRDLAALSALPSLWVRREPPEVVESFLDVLLATLRLDLAYMRVEHPKGSGPVEAARTSSPRRPRPAEIAAALAPYLNSAANGEIPSPIGPGKLRISVIPLPFGEGVVVAGSTRVTFPSPLETMVLSTAVNQAVHWLRMARLTVEKSVAESALAERVSSQSQLEDENAYLREEVEVLAFGGIVGQSDALRAVLSEIELVAPTDATVLILGESGTGKELFAREVHERSRRAGRPLIKVNCSAIPREMFESEFFGHVRGAFTGAHRDRPGRFKLAENGTIFLDEVGDLPLDLQPKLLRVLQEGQYERVGDDMTHSIDVRVIAATNRDLTADVAAGRFREDLYYRLSVFPIRIPPLRDRKEDIKMLAEHFIERVSKELGKPQPQITDAQVAALKAYDWPGNVRELQNVIERAVILSRGSELRLEQVLGARTNDQRRSSIPVPPQDEIIPDEEWRRLERANLIRALARSEGRIYGAGGAAELLGIRPSTLQSRLRALGIRARERR
jgi:DNA-binding NtrC family response regulator